ncbi:MAG TPA: GNAT family N-acetyltransferase [Acidimicrobiia bacterium]|nr:GNAT family N-acetyltransferase [Acidimicrobiia bacterium]
MTADPRLERLAHLNLAEFGRESARWSAARGGIHEADGVVRIMTGTTFPVLCNGALRLDPRADAGALVDGAFEWFGARGRGFSVWTRPDADADLVDVLVARGFHGSPPGSPEMICETPLDPPAPSVDLRWVTDERGVRDWVAVNAAAYNTYGMPLEVLPDILVDVDAFLAPHLHHVVAYVDEAPCAAAQVLLSHGIGGVYWVGTTEAARGRGLGEAVTRAVTNRAFEHGAAFVSLQASPMGEPIYRRLGYRELYRYVVWVHWPDAPEEAT